MKVLFFLCVCTFTLSACSSQFATKDCNTANWYHIGQNDAEKGKNVESFYEYQKICNEVSVTANEAQYVKGYTDKQKNYCTSENGYADGKVGKVLGDSCAHSKEYIAGFSKGRDAYLQEKEDRMAEKLTRQGGNLGAAPSGGRQ